MRCKIYNSKTILYKLMNMLKCYALHVFCPRFTSGRLLEVQRRGQKLSPYKDPVQEFRVVHKPKCSIFVDFVYLQNLRNMCFHDCL